VYFGSTCTDPPTPLKAWLFLPRALFHKLFRQDLLLASIFRNYLLVRPLPASSCLLLASCFLFLTLYRLAF
jgi:hypothetical protein